MEQINSMIDTYISLAAAPVQKVCWLPPPYKHSRGSPLCCTSGDAWRTLLRL